MSSASQLVTHFTSPLWGLYSWLSLNWQVCPSFVLVWNHLKKSSKTDRCQPQMSKCLVAGTSYGQRIIMLLIMLQLNPKINTGIQGLTHTSFHRQLFNFKQTVKFSSVENNIMKCLATKSKLRLFGIFPDALLNKLQETIVIFNTICNFKTILNFKSENKIQKRVQNIYNWVRNTKMKYKYIKTIVR